MSSFCSLASFYSTSILPSLALFNKKQEIIDSLANGIDVNQQGPQGMTALYYACWNNRVDIIHLLLQHPDINVNLCKRGGQSPLAVACECGKYNSVAVLIQDARVDINLPDENGYTPLMWACYDGKVQVVKLLLAFDRSVDVTKKTTKRVREWVLIAPESTVLEIAMKMNHTQIVSLLQEYMTSQEETKSKLKQELHLLGWGFFFSFLFFSFLFFLSFFPFSISFTICFVLLGTTIL